MREVRSEKSCAKARWLWKWGPRGRKKSFERGATHLSCLCKTTCFLLPPPITDSKAVGGGSSPSSVLTILCFHYLHPASSLCSTASQESYQKGPFFVSCTWQNLSSKPKPRGRHLARAQAGNTARQLPEHMCRALLCLTGAQAKNICLKFLYAASKV